MKTIIKAFIFVSIIYMFVGVLIGGIISGGPLAEYIETEEGHWLEAEHAFINFIGFLSFIVMGVLFHIVPQISGKKIYSKKLAKYTFLILNIGFLLAVLSIFFKGLFSTITFLSQFIMLGGILLTVGYFMFGYNILKSL